MSLDAMAEEAIAQADTMGTAVRSCLVLHILKCCQISVAVTCIQCNAREMLYFWLLDEANMDSSQYGKLVSCGARSHVQITVSHVGPQAA
jgi:hypothetical protein